MPLVQGKSKEAFNSNIKAEMEAGKPMKQSLAIAYAVKKKNQKANGGMAGYAEGGKVSDSDKLKIDLQSPLGGEDMDPELAKYLPPKKMAHGGMMDPKHMANMIVQKKAKGGMVEFNDSADYELSKEDSALDTDEYDAPDGDGSMPYGEEALYEDGNSSMEQMRDHLPSDAEHEIEGSGEMRQAMARKGMLSKILGNIRSKNIGH